MVFGGIAFLLEYNQIGERIAERAELSAGFFNAQTRHLFDRRGPVDKAELQAQLELIASQPRNQEFGRFVSVEVNDINGTKLAELHENSYPLIDAVDNFMRNAPQSDAETYQNITIDGDAHAYVIVPLFDSSGETAAIARGVFVLSEAAFAQIYRRLVLATGATIAIIVITSLLLYPIINHLMGQLSLLSSRLLDANLEMLEVLGSAIAKRDSDTDVHNYRVTIYSVRLAESIDCDRHSIRGLIKGAFLHDVGKIGITDNILLKPGRLDEAEFEIMKQHVQHGLDIVERSEWLRDAAPVVGFHHEKVDGSGYNEKLVEGKIPLNARIFAIADVFDALTSERPYKKPFDFDKAMQILDEGAGSHFDKKLLEAFSRIAESLYQEYANRDDDKPRDDLAVIVDEYFKNEAELVAETQR